MEQLGLHGLSFASIEGPRWSSWVCMASALPALRDQGGAAVFAWPQLCQHCGTKVEQLGLHGLSFASIEGPRWSSWVCMASALPALRDQGGAVGFAWPQLCQH